MASLSIPKHTGRGKAWSQAEDLDLCQSWIKISEDPVTGGGQKQEQFWARIHKETNSSRTVRALQSRWKAIRHDVSKFCALFLSSVRLNESGKNDEDRVVDCMNAFKMQPWNSSGYEFSFLECWYYLKEKPKWSPMNSTMMTPSKKSNRNKANPGNQAKVLEDNSFDEVWGNNGLEDDPKSEPSVMNNCPSSKAEEVWQMIVKSWYE